MTILCNSDVMLSWNNGDSGEYGDDADYVKLNSHTLYQI